MRQLSLKVVIQPVPGDIGIYCGSQNLNHTVWTGACLLACILFSHQYPYHTHHPHPPHAPSRSHSTSQPSLPPSLYTAKQAETPGSIILCACYSPLKSPFITITSYELYVRWAFSAPFFFLYQPHFISAETDSEKFNDFFQIYSKYALCIY